MQRNHLLQQSTPTNVKSSIKIQITVNSLKSESNVTQSTVGTLEKP